jgi:hypothetical protein
MLSDGDKALVVKATSVSGNVVVLRKTDIQDSVSDTKNVS